jgi:hypothetical protein
MRRWQSGRRREGFHARLGGEAAERESKARREIRQKQADMSVEITPQMIEAIVLGFYVINQCVDRASALETKP